jgi:hypothetical protein
MDATSTSYPHNTGTSVGPHPPGQMAPDRPPSTNPALLRVGAVTLVSGIAVEVVMQFLHPSKADPNDSVAAFQEYAHSSIWTDVHIGQFAGTLLIVLGLVALSRALSRQPRLPGALAIVGGVTAILVAAVFAVQMAVDGVALKGAIDAWTHAAPADKVSAFQVADGIRWIEKALSGFFHLVNGATLLALGLSMALGRAYPRWLGWIGAIAGIGFLAGGRTVAHTGFSAQAGTLLQVALVLSLVFMIGSSIVMWRRSRQV